MPEVALSPVVVPESVDDADGGRGILLGGVRPRAGKRLDAKDAAGGFRRFTTAAQHVPSGRLVAFTDLYVRPGRSSVARQDDTLVVREHRGHSLGMLVKGELLLALHRDLPDITTIETFNAEENRNMLAINEAMGFTPVLYAGEWQKRIT